MKKSKNKILSHPLLLLVLVILIIAGAVFAIKPKVEETQRLEEIKELTEKSFDPAYAEHGSQKRTEVRKRLCLLTARSPEEREKAVVAIRDFLDKPTAEVEYVCSDAFYSLDEDGLIPARTETYSVGFDLFGINPATNHIVEYSEQGGTWGYKEDDSRWFSERKQVDYTNRYSQKELEEVATEFIKDHSLALGEIDLDQYELDIQTKDGTTYLFRWLLNGCEYAKGCTFFELVYSAGGNLLRYSSNLEGENGRMGL